MPRLRGDLSSSAMSRQVKSSARARGWRHGLGAAVLLGVIHGGQSPAALQEPRDPERPPVFRIARELVQFDAVVIDDHGTIVPTLTREDFDVRQDGVPVALQDAAFVDRAARLAMADRRAVPRMGIDVDPLVFLIDDMAMTPDGFHRVLKGLREFVLGGILPGMEAGILRTGQRGRRTTAMTADRAMLLKQVDSMRYLARSLRPGLASGSGASGPGTRQREKAFLEGTLGSLNSLLLDLRRFPGRKTVVLFSEGVALEPGARQGDPVEARLDQLAQLAAEAGVTVHSIDVTGVGAGAGSLAAGISLRDGLVALPERMAGLYLGLSNDLIVPLRRIMAFERGYYLLTYEPPAGTFVAGARTPFRRLAVRIRHDGLTVRSRAGFFAKP
jgi:VWFA-related protein